MKRTLPPSKPQPIEKGAKPPTGADWKLSAILISLFAIPIVGLILYLTVFTSGQSGGGGRDCTTRDTVASYNLCLEFEKCEKFEGLLRSDCNQQAIRDAFYR